MTEAASLVPGQVRKRLPRDGDKGETRGDTRPAETTAEKATAEQGQEQVRRCADNFSSVNDNLCLRKSIGSQFTATYKSSLNRVIISKIGSLAAYLSDCCRH